MMRDSNDRPRDYNERLLAQFQVPAVPPGLRRATRFLLDARTPGEGWGVLATLPTDLHQTALALDALTLAAPEDSVREVDRIAAECGRFVWSAVGEKLELLTLDQHIDAAAILRRHGDAHPEVRKTVLATLRRKYNEQIRDTPRPDIVLVARLMLVFAGYAARDSTEFELGAKQLIDVQQSDGSWGPAKSEAQLVLTAWAARALGTASGELAHRAATRGVDFLWARIESAGWYRLGLVDDSYLLGTVLRTLGDRPQGHLDRLLDGLSRLERLQRPDGGWAGSADAPSTVERTAAATAAIVTVTGTTMVPARLADLCLKDPPTESRRSRPTESGTVAEARANRTNIMFNTAVTIAVSLTSAVTAITLAQDSWGSSQPAALPVTVIVLSLTAFGAAIVTITEQFRSRRNRRNRRRLRSLRSLRDRHVSAVATVPEAMVQPELDWEPLVNQYRRITSLMPTKSRRELIYLLYEEFLDVPPDVAARRSLSAGHRLGLGTDATRRFSSWAAEVAMLDEHERRVLLERLRRVEL